MKKTTALILFFAVILFFASAATALWFYAESEKLRGIVEQQQERLSAVSAMLAKANESIRYLNNSLEQAEAGLYLANEQLNLTTIELDETRQRLEERESELALVREELNTTKTLLNITRSDYALLAAEVAALEDSINESIQWFRENSFLPGSADWFTYRVQNRCVKNKKVNLACVAYLMGQKLGFMYISEEGDRLFSIDEIISRRGGDCEDFSLLSKAMLNTLKAMNEDAVVEAWSSGDGRYVVYEEREGTTATEWYVDGEGVSLGELERIVPYVICFAVDYRSGHCIVALSEKNITSVGELGALEGAALFEPQNGMYMGKVGSELMLCGSSIQNCERVPGRISFVISDDDLYQFSGGEWKSYDTYMQKAGGMKQVLEEAFRVE